MFKKIYQLVNKTYLNKNYNFQKKNVVFFYEVGCFLQKKKFNIFADLMFSIPYLIFSIFNMRSLDFNQVCYLFNTDKSREEFSLADNYERYFFKIRNQKLKILEIGIGGHNQSHLGGSSLRAFQKYFKKSNIFGIDISDKNLHSRPRIKVFKGSQIDKEFLKKIVELDGPFDIIIDDGSHYVAHQIFSFKFLFEHLKNKGIYIIEDTLSAYMKYMGGSTNIDDKQNLITLFSKYAHNVHSEVIFPEEIKKLDKEVKISSIQFYNKYNRACIIMEKLNTKKDSEVALRNPHFKNTSEEISKLFPNNKHNRKSKEGTISSE